MAAKAHDRPWQEPRCDGEQYQAVQYAVRSETHSMNDRAAEMRKDAGTYRERERLRMNRKHIAPAMYQSVTTLAVLYAVVSGPMTALTAMSECSGRVRIVNTIPSTVSTVMSRT
jgi:hypothetical protein